MTLKNKPHRTKHDWYMCVRALASGNATLSHFTISKSYFINYTIPFYNTPNIPKFYFAILHIKIIYLHNKLYFWFFSNFFLLLSSTSITAPPLPSHHHCASTMPTMPPLPTAHQNPITVYRTGPDREVGPWKPGTGMKTGFLSLKNRIFC